MTITSMVDIVPGAYYTFTPDDRHCVEGIVFADQLPDGSVVLRDTFWGPEGSQAFLTGHNHLSEPELSTLELHLNPADGWRRTTANDRTEHFNPDDVRAITSQHRLQRVTWVRETAGPSKAIEIQKAKDELADLRAAAEAAVRKVEWQAMQVGRLVSEATQAAAIETKSQEGSDA